MKIINKKIKLKNCPCCHQNSLKYKEETINTLPIITCNCGFFFVGEKCLEICNINNPKTIWFSIYGKPCQEYELEYN